MFASLPSPAKPVLFLKPKSVLHQDTPARAHFQFNTGSRLRIMTLKSVIFILFALSLRAASAGVETTIPARLQSSLNTGVQGTVVSLRNVNPLSCASIPMTQAPGGGKLIFSDSPESPTNTGILYADSNLAATAESLPNRIFVYHVNDCSSGNMKISVLLKNNGRHPANLIVQRTGTAGPSPNYLSVGQMAFYHWLTNKTILQTIIAPGQMVRLDTNFDSIDVRRGDLINGIWDYTFDQPHAVIVCAVHAADSPLAVEPGLKILGRDGHDRGTFAYCNKTYTTRRRVVIATASRIRQFPIGGNGDTYVTGYDETAVPPAAAIDDGNYGVFYNIQIETVSDGDHRVALLISPQGGSWCGAVNAMPGLLAGGAFIIPAGGRPISSPSAAAIAGEYFLNGPKSVRFQFMPTGASSFPVSVMLIPYAGTIER